MNINNQLLVIKKASICIEKKNYVEAKDVLLDFIKKNKNLKIDIKFYYTLYLAFYELKETQNAKKYLERCLKINEFNHIVLNNLGNIFFREGNFQKAENYYLKSFKQKNDYLIVIINLAILYQNLGNFEKSKKFYLEAIKLSPRQISLYSNLSRIDKNFIDQEKIDYLKNLMKNEKLEKSEVAYGFFLMADYEKKKKNFIKEIDYLNKGHKIAFDEKKNANELTLEYWRNVIPKKYDKFSFVNDEENSQFKSINPIFIVGLPRSGSTVTEVLLTSGKKKITSLGESNIINGIVAKKVSNPKELKIDLNYLNHEVSNIFNERNYNIINKTFVDKSLENFFYIEIILKIFPKAKFINTFRNIEDNIFAIFKVFLKLSWTHTIDDIVEYVDNYLKIMDYFVKKYPDKILQINLEELNKNPEEISKKIYSFCNLEWSNKILNFKNRDDLLVSTASNIQIRDSIKSYDYDKYKPYKYLLKSYLKNYNWINQK